MDSIASLLKDKLSGRPGPFVLGVSGGLDSMALLYAAFRSLPPEQILVAHYDHGVRGKASDEDRKFVESTAQKLGLACRVGKGRGDFLDEARLRAERRAFLEKVRLEVKAQWIVTAHHLEDQWETFWFRHLRGAGLWGLSAMREQDGVWLRPFLFVSQSRLHAWAEEQQVPFREDESNQSARYSRNRIRHELRPVVEKLSQEFGGWEAYLERFALMMKELHSASAAVLEREDQLWKSLCEKHDGRMVFPRSAFLALSPSDRAVFLRSFWRRSEKPLPDRQTIQRILTDLEIPRRGIQAEPGMDFRIRGDQVFVSSGESIAVNATQ